MEAEPRTATAGTRRGLSALLANREAQRFLKFVVVGGIGFCVDTGTLTILALIFGVDRVVAKAVAFALAVLNNFIWNRLWTYPEARSKSLLTQVALFVAVSVVGLASRFWSSISSIKSLSSTRTRWLRCTWRRPLQWALLCSGTTRPIASSRIATLASVVD